MSQETIFLLSNGSLDAFADNTLTAFKNKLPKIFETTTSSKYEVAVESIGFSCNFRNIMLPPYHESSMYPSVIVSNIRFNMDKNYTFQFQSNEDGHNCQWHKFYFQDKYYNEDDFRDFFKVIDNKTNLTHFSFDNGKIELRKNLNSIKNRGYYIFFHPSFLKTFGILTYDEMQNLPKIITSKNIHNYRMRKILKDFYAPSVDNLSYNMSLDPHEVITVYNNEVYYGYHISNEKHYIFGTKNVFKKRYPDLVKVKSENIETQIFNQTYSQDLVVFSPDLVNCKNYYFHEFLTKEYCTISNTILNEFAIKICDEKNNQLELLPGSATLVKLHIRKMQKTDNNFNIRLTSNANPQFPDNKNSSFKVLLPDTLILDRRWKAALTSITHPIKFSTFLTSTECRKIVFRGQNSPEIELLLSDDIEYSEETLIEEINLFFINNQIGKVIVNEKNQIEFHCEKDGYLIIPHVLLKMLGYEHGYIPKGEHTYIHVKINRDISDKQIVKFTNKLNLQFFRPTYIMVYANFITSSIVGGEYSKLFKIIPLKEISQNYIITEFQHKEFFELQNTDIKFIEIELRAHDGNFINFLSKSNVILNVEFHASDHI